MALPWQEKQKEFLRYILTGDQKLINYDNPRVETPVRASRRDLYLVVPAKRFVVWVVEVDWNNHRFRTRLIRLSEVLEGKCSRVTERRDKRILQVDNVYPHVTKMVKTNFESLKSDYLSHPLFSPDIDPVDYHLFP